MTQPKKKTQDNSVKRCFKSQLFAMIYEDKRELLELYNGISGKHYQDPELLEINTLKNAIYMSMQNDVSFLIDSQLSLYEHQSTYNPNLPLRYLFYISDLYSGMTKDENLYGTKRIHLPSPQFFVFYNGEKEQPDHSILKLSDAYKKRGQVSLELQAVMLNINKGHNPKLMKACKSLRDYAEYTVRVRRYTKEMDLEDAVERAITECIQEGILQKFLEENRAEAKRVSIYEYDMEKHMRQEREEARSEGRKALFQELIEKKLTKGKSIAVIAQELEMEEEKVQAIIEQMNESESER